MPRPARRIGTYDRSRLGDLDAHRRRHRRGDLDRAHLHVAGRLVREQRDELLRELPEHRRRGAHVAQHRELVSDERVVGHVNAHGYRVMRRASGNDIEGNRRRPAAVVGSTHDRCRRPRDGACARARCRGRGSVGDPRRRRAPGPRRDDHRRGAQHPARRRTIRPGMPRSRRCGMRRHPSGPGISRGTRWS